MNVAAGGSNTTQAGQLPMPGILYGTAWKKDDTARLVALALRCGFRGIDTACQPKHYNEAGVGAVVAESGDDTLTRADLFLQTKFTPLSGQDPARVPYDPRASLPEQVEQSFATSLQNLRTSYLDCLILHSPLPTLDQTLTVWRSLECLVERGGVRRIGLSNCYDLAQLTALVSRARVPPAVLQNRFYAETGYDREIRAFCRDRGIIYQSFWTLTANPVLLGHPALVRIARREGRTSAQVLFRFLSQVGAVPLTGTRQESHMREALAIFEFTLTQADCQSLEGILSY